MQELCLMDKESRVLAIIPARGGSKRLPRKNVMPLSGKPLIAWTIEAAIQAEIANKIVVTTDDDEILSVATRYNISPLKRANELATDTTSTIDVLLNVIHLEESAGGNFDTIILLQPTSPLRDSTDLIAAYQKFQQGSGQSVVSVCEIEHPLEWCGMVTDEGLLYGFDIFSNKRSQDFTKRYRLNGAIYIAKTETVKRGSLFTKETLAFIMSKDKSVDIDELYDFNLANEIIKSKM